MNFFGSLMGDSGLKYGIIVEKKVTQKFLKHPSLSKFIARGRGMKTAGPVDASHLENIVLRLSTGRSDEGDTPSATDLDASRLVYLENLEDPAQLVKIHFDIESSAYLTRYEHDVDPRRVSFHDALVDLLPSGTVIPGSFETVGHIAHLNLLPEHLPYKHQIGQLLIQKMPAIKTVVNKTHELSSEFRACPLEIIGGDANLVTTHIEHGLKFHIDYEHVFWNSRLAGERYRLTTVIPPGSDVYDVMGGVGSFGIYLAKLNNCHVVSNDLNPTAHACAEQNIKVNKLSSLMQSCNMDAREFVRAMLNPKFGPSCLQKPLQFPPDPADEPATLEVLSDGGESSPSQKSLEILKRRRRKGDQSDSAPTSKEVIFENTETPTSHPPPVRDSQKAIYFLMNLPRIAMRFLDAFVGSCPRQLPAEVPELHVLVYCFASPNELQETIESRLKDVVGEKALALCKVDSITPVRNVSPSKNQYCIDLILSPDFLKYSTE